MNTFEITLTKSYKITIHATDKESATRYSEYFTSDIKDVSNDMDRRKLCFNIESIECKLNEALETVEVKNG